MQARARYNSSEGGSEELTKAVAAVVPLRHKVNLGLPDCTLLVEGLKTVNALGYARRYVHARRYNLEEVRRRGVMGSDEVDALEAARSVRQQEKANKAASSETEKPKTEEAGKED